MRKLLNRIFLIKNAYCIAKAVLFEDAQKLVADSLKIFVLVSQPCSTAARLLRYTVAPIDEIAYIR